MEHIQWMENGKKGKDEGEKERKERDEWINESIHISLKY